jgi:sulfite exporter TauE/SafE
MNPSRITSLLLAGAALVLVLVNIDMHESARKDWLVIFLGAVIVVLGVVSFVLARREARGPGKSGRAH